MAATLKIDTKPFERELRRYHEATKKDAQYVVARQALNVSIKAAQATPVADPGKIEEVTKKEWWPKYVAKRLSRLKRTEKRREKGKSGYTRAQAKQASKSIINARKRRVGFLRSGWKPAIVKLSTLRLKLRWGGALRGTGRIKNPPGDVVLPRPGNNPVAVLIHKASAGQPIVAKALQNALIAAAADIRQFIRERYTETARRYRAT